MANKHIYIKVLDRKIISFIKKHHVLTLATAFNNKPYCCTCFYVYMEKENKFLITSDKDTRHIAEAMKQPCVSGAIALETTMVGKIQGIQFTGTITEVKEEDAAGMKKAYIRRLPVAAFSELLMWCIEPDFIKFTDNRLGFGKKMIWQQEKK
jgi:uncharacterized protein YhbP (UPF0306 family)